MIDPDGNIINRVTKQIIERNDTGYVPTQEEMKSAFSKEPEQPTQSPVSALSIQDQIEQTKKLLAELELRKKEQIEEMKRQLALLEQ